MTRVWPNFPWEKVTTSESLAVIVTPSALFWCNLLQTQMHLLLLLSLSLLLLLFVLLLYSLLGAWILASFLLSSLCDVHKCFVYY